MKTITFIMIIILLFVLCSIIHAEEKYIMMTSTGYTVHKACTPNLLGITAMNTKVRKGIAAINVDWHKDKWIVKSPLKLGQKIYIEGLGHFKIEDTGYFTEKNFKWDYWNIDLYFDTYAEAKSWGIRMVKVYISWEF